MRFIKLALAALAFALLAGCAQPLKKQAYNREATPHVKTVVIAQPQNQESYECAVLGHPGMSFGLIGGLVAVADMQFKTGKLSAAVDPGQTRLQERFTARLSERLAEIGYRTQIVVLPKDTKEDQFVAYAKQQAKGDAIVTLNVFGGYWAAGPTSDYFPRLVARVRGVDAASDKVLYEDTFSYGYTLQQAQTVHLASDPQYRFADVDALIADPGKTRQGWYDGVDAITAQIVADLRRD